MSGRPHSDQYFYRSAEPDTFSAETVIFGAESTLFWENTEKCRNDRIPKSLADEDLLRIWESKFIVCIDVVNSHSRRCSGTPSSI